MAAGRCGRPAIAGAAGLLLIAAVASLARPSGAASAPAELVSAGAGGVPLATDEIAPSISGDGSVVAFNIRVIAPGFTGGISLGPDGVWVRSRAQPAAQPVPLAPGASSSFGGDLSRDGCHVSYWAGMGGGSDQIVVWDRCAGAGPRLVTAFGPGTSGGLTSISADGSTVAFTAFVCAAACVQRIAAVDSATGAITPIPLPAGTTTPDEPDISDGGQFVAFTALLPGGGSHVAGWTRGASTAEILSVTGGGQPATGRNIGPAVSADGRYVAFASDSAAMGVPVAGRTEIFVRDRTGGVTAQITGTAGAPGGADEPDLSADGTQVAFTVVLPGADFWSVHLARSTSGFFTAVEREVVSYGVDGQPVDNADSAAISATGRFVAFSSFSGTQLSGQPAFPAGRDIWLRERPPALGVTNPIDFGAVLVGGSATRDAVVTNTGAVAVGVQTIGIGPGPYAVTADGCTGAVLAPGGQCTLTIAFGPGAAGPAAGTLDVEGDGTATAASLTGEGQAPATTTTTPTTTSVPPPTDPPPTTTTRPPTTTTQPPTTTAPPTTIPVFTPTLVMSPAVVRPGQVTTAVGTGFPPGVAVGLAFAGEAPFTTVTADAGGSFRSSLLILRNGVRIGGTTITALGQAQFANVPAPLLINPATFQPSGAAESALSTEFARALYARNG